MKSRTKKILIVGTTSLFLFFISIFFVTNTQYYHLTKKIHFTESTQKIFWRSISDNERFKKAGGQDFQRFGGGFSGGGPAFKSFNLNLYNQGDALYSYEPRPGEENILRITVGQKGSDNKIFTFYVNRKNLKIIKDDSKYRNEFVISPEERVKLDKQNTPDSITDTDKLEKLAIKRLVEFQDEYFNYE